jgi:phosphatidylinositol alpha-1,6-mannosyltransferase
VPPALLVSSSFLPGKGGIESHLGALCAWLSPRLAVLAPATRDGTPLPTDLGYPTRGYPGSMLVPSAPVRRAIEEAAAAYGTDRVLFGTPWPLALLGPSLARRGLRYAIVVHGAEAVLPGAVPFLRHRLARALAGADLLLPVSRFTAGRLRPLVEAVTDEAPPMALLRPRVDTTRFHPGAADPAARASLGLAESDRLVLCLGRLVRRKGVHRVVGALSELARRVPDVALVVAGAGPELARLRRLARRVRERVVLAGRVPDADAPALYASADVFCLPASDRWWGLDVEGLGVVLLEAAASGVPCVTGRSGGTPEAVLDGRTGWVVDARDRSQLVDALARVLSDPDEARAMGAAGRSHMVESFGASSPPQALLDWLGCAP